MGRTANFRRLSGYNPRARYLTGLGRHRGRLGQADLVTLPLYAIGKGIESYNAGVAAQEAAANPANAPMASTADLNNALALAQQNNVDPSVIQSLWMAGADSLQLQMAASSPAQAAAALAPGGALESLTGVTPPAGQPMTDALLYPASDVPQYDTSLPAIAASAIYGSPTGPGGLPSWCTQDALGLGLTNCVYLAIGGGALLLWWLWARR